MKTIVNLFLLSTIAVLLGGCASTGNNFDESKLSQLKKGETTETELVQMFGQPEQRGMNSEGMTTLTWMYQESTVKGESFIPYAGPFIGGTRSRNKTLTVILNNGRVANYHYCPVKNPGK